MWVGPPWDDEGNTACKLERLLKKSFGYMNYFNCNELNIIVKHFAICSDTTKGVLSPTMEVSLELCRIKNDLT